MLYPIIRILLMLCGVVGIFYVLIEVAPINLPLRISTLTWELQINLIPFILIFLIVAGSLYKIIGLIVSLYRNSIRVRDIRRRQALVTTAVRGEWKQMAKMLDQSAFNKSEDPLLILLKSMSSVAEGDSSKSQTLLQKLYGRSRRGLAMSRLLSARIFMWDGQLGAARSTLDRDTSDRQIDKIKDELKSKL